MPTLAQLFGAGTQGLASPGKNIVQPTSGSPKMTSGAAGRLSAGQFGETEVQKKPLGEQLAGKTLTEVLGEISPEADPNTFMREQMTQDPRSGLFTVALSNERLYFKPTSSPPTPDTLIVVPPTGVTEEESKKKQEINPATGLNPQAFGGA